MRGRSTADEQRIACLVRDSWATGGVPRSALVVSGDLAFGLSRKYEAHLEDSGEALLLAGPIADVGTTSQYSQLVCRPCRRSSIITEATVLRRPEE